MCLSKVALSEVAVYWDEVRNTWGALEISGNIDSNITIEDNLGGDEDIETTEYLSDDDIPQIVASNYRSEIVSNDDDESIRRLQYANFFIGFSDFVK